ncbi:hypothetical protein [Streptomyces sp. AN091965]|uniref:hypothetical protein n=1 Tax=Streptomyces sp. AN091965 TaxID=2927803 RepID=UPI001F6261A0|nr:hypothetical protein [Streptomyces sp. AN091965]MCI3928801.1 hypothetical protein [Streptomyces sp. AN091965]
MADQAPTGIVDWVAKGVTAAINAFFKGIVSAALNPLLKLLGDTLLTTPEPGSIPRVGELWADSWKITLASYGLLVMVAGVLLMGHQTVQNRYSLRELAPRIPLGFLAAGLSLLLADKAVELANALSMAVLGPGLDEDAAGTALRDFVLSSFTSDSSIFIILMLGVVAVLLVALLVTYIVRVALTILLIAGAPLALMCHALPQTDGIARWWWRVFAGLLAIQVAQSMALVVGIRVFLTPGNFSPFGSEQHDLVSVLVSLALMYILFKIPFWILSSARVGHGRSFTGRIVRAAVAYKTFGLLRRRPARAAAGHGGWGGRGGPGAAAPNRQAAAPAAPVPVARQRRGAAGTPGLGGRGGARPLRPPGPPLFLSPHQPAQAPGQAMPPPAVGHAPGPPPMPAFLAASGQSGMATSGPRRPPTAPAPTVPAFRPPVPPSTTRPLPRPARAPAAPVFQEPRSQPSLSRPVRATRPPAPATFRPPPPVGGTPPPSGPTRPRGDRR